MPIPFPIRPNFQNYSDVGYLSFQRPPIHNPSIHQPPTVCQQLTDRQQLTVRQQTPVQLIQNVSFSLFSYFSIYVNYKINSEED